MTRQTKNHMPIQQTTAFWKSMGIDIRRRAKAIKKGKLGADKAVLRRSGVSEAAIDKVHTICMAYDDVLFFRKFSKFFRKDIETVKAWTKTKTASAAFEKLFNVFQRNNIEQAKRKFSELALVFEFYKKGEGQVYSGVISQKVSLKDFNTTNLRRRLSLTGGTSEYIEKGSTDLGKERILWLQKNTDGKKTNKFIKLIKQRAQLYVALSMDSKKEYYLAKGEIERKFNTILETPEETPDLKKFLAFVRTGNSQHFILTGCSYIDAEFRVSIGPSHNRIENVAELPVYKDKIGSDNKKLTHLTQVRLSYKNKILNKPIFVSILTYREGIFGAILLHPEDSRLTTTQRKNLLQDFVTDFGFSLNHFLLTDDLTDKSIYRHFLETVPSKITKMELRSPLALKIYTNLITDGLFEVSDTTEETSKTCVNSTCAAYYKPVWETKKYCPICSEVLIGGRSIEIKKINEKNIAEFIRDKFKDGMVSISKRKILSRQIYISQAIYNDETVDFIPISKALSENQLIILKYRYPHAVIVTTRPDARELTAKGFQVISLWELTYDIYHKSCKEIKAFADNSRANSLANMRGLCTKAVVRISDTSYYKDRNAETKNLGAELFEADASVLFDYVFGNCLWLGAKYRGASLPDGLTAFPMLGTNHGCFIWDGKFSEGANLVMGGFLKNKKYIEDARKNQSLKDNGGLKGFLFISNNLFPPSFVNKYKPLTKGKKIKISFIRAIQFQKIAQHYMKYEKIILNNSNARLQFIESMSDLFFNTAKGRKCEIISDVVIDVLIAKDKTVFTKLKSGKYLLP